MHRTEEDEVQDIRVVPQTQSSEQPQLQQSGKHDSHQTASESRQKQNEDRTKEQTSASQPKQQTAKPKSPHGSISQQSRQSSPRPPNEQAQEGLDSAAGESMLHQGVAKATVQTGEHLTNFKGASPPGTSHNLVTDSSFQSSPKSLNKQEQRVPNLTNEEQTLLQGAAKGPKRTNKMLLDLLEESDNHLPPGEMLQKALDRRRRLLGNQIQVPLLGKHLRGPSQSRPLSPKTPKQEIQGYPIFQPSPGEASTPSSVTDKASGLNLRPQLGLPATSTTEDNRPQDESKLRLQLLRSYSAPWDKQRIIAHDILAHDETQHFALSAFNRLASENARGSYGGSSQIGVGPQTGLRRTQSERTSGGRTTREGSQFG